MELVLNAQDHSEYFGRGTQCRSPVANSEARCFRGQVRLRQRSRGQFFGQLVVPGRLARWSWDALRSLAEAAAVRVAARRNAGCKSNRVLGCLFVSLRAARVVHLCRLLRRTFGDVSGHVRSHFVARTHVHKMHGEHWRDCDLGPYQEREEQNRSCGPLRHSSILSQQQSSSSDDNHRTRRPGSPRLSADLGSINP